MPLDALLLPADPARGPPTLRWSNGDGCTESSFLPHDEPLGPGAPREFAATSSDTTCLPFFNLQAAEAGWIVAVGWTGRWKAGFLHEPSGAVRVSAGMQSTRFRLKPGERVRTPRIVLLRYGGRRLIDGHNAFRRLMLAHYVPQEGDKPAMPPVATNNVAGLWLRSARTKQPLGLLNEAERVGADSAGRGAGLRGLLDGRLLVPAAVVPGQHRQLVSAPGRFSPRAASAGRRRPPARA